MIWGRVSLLAEATVSAKALKYLKNQRRNFHVTTE
jgi:hypothetical protein